MPLQLNINKYFPFLMINEKYSYRSLSRSNTVMFPNFFSPCHFFKSISSEQVAGEKTWHC